MAVITVENNAVAIPEEARTRLNIHDGDQLTLTVSDDRLVLRRKALNEADKTLLDLYRDPVDMGQVRFEDRSDIYGGIGRL